MPKLRSFLIVSSMAVRLLGCSSETHGTVVAGSINLTRTDGTETGQTGFSFPDDTLLDGGPFVGSCTIEHGPDGSTLLLDVQRTKADAFGLVSFSVVSPIADKVASETIEVTARAVDATFADQGRCAMVFGGYDDFTGSVELSLECEALVVQEESSASGAASLNASLSLEACDVVE